MLPNPPVQRCIPTLLFLCNRHEHGVAVVTAIDIAVLSTKVVAFTDYLFNSFFLPVKSCTLKTPTPASLSPTVAAGDTIPGSRTRVSTWRDCLIRAKHRCVVTRKFDTDEARRRYTEHGENAVDDDGQLFDWTNSSGFQDLQVAHILPHSLTNLQGSPEIVRYHRSLLILLSVLTASPVAARANALAILAMFDIDVHRLITGTDINRPTNAITLTTACHEEFGMFRMCIEAAAPPRTYRIASYDVPTLSAVPQPLTRTLFPSPTIDSPSPRLLAVHAAIARVLHISGAGEYCDDILRDTDDSAVVESDATTNLGTLVALRVNGWWMVA